MGYFDTIVGKCPVCECEVYFQSKGGSCSMNDYSVESAPHDVLSDSNRHPGWCEECEIVLRVDTGLRKIVKH